MHNRLLELINVIFVKIVNNYDNTHYSKIKTYQGATQSHLKHCSESSVSLCHSHCFQQESEQVSLPFICKQHNAALASSTTRHLEFRV